MEVDVVIVGGGVAGLSAAVLTARAELETLILDAGGSLLRRNAHLENVPGFPAGVNSRQFSDLLTEQAGNAGAERREARVVAVERIDPMGYSEDDENEPDFRIRTADGSRFTAEYVIAASKNETSYLDGSDGVGLIDRGGSVEILRN